jgi:hypothetical protein
MTWRTFGLVSVAAGCAYTEPVKAKIKILAVINFTVSSPPDCD